MGVIPYIPRRRYSRTIKSKEETMCLCGCEGACQGKEKVFCEECKYYCFDKLPRIDKEPHKCKHPKIYNRERKIPDTPIKRGYIHKYKILGNCEELNRNNDCEFFEAK